MFLVQKAGGMIVTRLCGGLGNQLFQYAAARRLAHRLETELVLDPGWYARIPSSDTPRKYELDNYPVRGRKTSQAESCWCRLHQGRLLRRLPFLPRKWKHCRETTAGFDPAILALPDNVYLDGYWQSPKYFEDIADLIREELTPIPSPGVDDAKVHAQIRAGVSVAVHVRRGDYVTNAAAASMHGVCSLDYYRAALEYLAARLTQPRFFVFSDDPQWVRANLPLPGPGFFVDHNGPDGAFQDLRLMAACEHQVMANSSFSWWGGWLNPREDKIVVMPKQWFAGTRDAGDMALPGWVRL